MKTLKLVIIGGVAAGASAAAKARRCNEEAEILLFEKGEHISYATCGLPYYLSGVIKKHDDLLVTDAAFFKERFNVDIRTNHEVISINRDRKTVSVRRTDTREEFEESYDKLIYGPGADPIMPPITGLDADFVFTLKTLADTDKIYAFMQEHKPQKAIIIGGGLIGIEAMENFVVAGMEVSIVEFMPQILTFLDPEMAAVALQHAEQKGVKAYLAEKVTNIRREKHAGFVTTDKGTVLEADIVIMAVGVRPNTKLAREAGLAIGDLGGVRVNENMQTSDPDIYAAGDCIESVNIITGKPALIPMGDAANKQGRAAGANAMGRSIKVKGFTGTVIVKMFDLAVAKTGFSERDAEKEGFDPQVTYVIDNHHAGYYPGAKVVRLKIVADRKSGRLLGAQAIGAEGVDKRIDVLSTAIYNNMVAEDLIHLDLAYAPPYSSARDPIIVCGAVNQNIQVKDWQPISPPALKEKMAQEREMTILDVRTAGELRRLGKIPGAVHIPIDELRNRIDELDSAKEIVIYCAVGVRSYLGNRILNMKGFTRVKTLTGGFSSWVYPVDR